MKSWFSTSELAGLPDLPSSTAGTTRKAKREHWRARRRNGQGGGREYHIKSLPAAAQEALHCKHEPLPANGKESAIHERVEPKLAGLKELRRKIILTKDNSIEIKVWLLGTQIRQVAFSLDPPEDMRVMP